MNQAIADIIKSHIEGLDFVDKIAGLVRTLTFDIVTKDSEGKNVPVQKSFPVACCVTADDCKNGAYNELMPNSQYKTVIYFEDMGVTAGDIEGRYSYFTSNVRLVCWINAAKILGDTCKTGTACTLSAHFISEIIRALPEFKQHHNPFNMVLSKVTSQEVSSPSIFSQYTYDEKHTQYLMYPYDYFALDIQTEFAICLKGTGVYDSDCGHRTDILDAPVATAGTGATSSSFIAHTNAVTGATGYAIDVATDSGFTDFVLRDERLGNVLNVSITGLNQGTTYYYRFRAYNDFTESENSNVIAIDTNPAIIDVDGNIYTSVIIGTQEWMVENLKVIRYNDGTPIPNLAANGDWLTEDGSVGHDGAYCWYNNDISNKTPYGALYNWYAVNNAHGLAPTGWRVPSQADFNTLITFIGDISDAGGKLKEIGYSHWDFPNNNATNDYGFTALPGGVRYPVGFTGGEFHDLRGYCNLMTSTLFDASRMYYWFIINGGTGEITNNKWGLTSGMSIRCVRDI